MCTKVEGWSNAQTHLVKLWLDNDKALYDRVQTMLTLHSSRHTLAFALQNMIEAASPWANPRPTLYTDLLQSALNMVDWQEIADEYLAELSPVHPLFVGQWVMLPGDEPYQVLKIYSDGVSLDNGRPWRVYGWANLTNMSELDYWYKFDL